MPRSVDHRFTELLQDYVIIAGTCCDMSLDTSVAIATDCGLYG
jgi:hypothetical protein